MDFANRYKYRGFAVAIMVDSKDPGTLNPGYPRRLEAQATLGCKGLELE